jgi:hypothetical protein
MVAKNSQCKRQVTELSVRLQVDRLNSCLVSLVPSTKPPVAELESFHPSQEFFSD